MQSRNNVLAYFVKRLVGLKLWAKTENRMLAARFPYTY